MRYIRGRHTWGAVAPREATVRDDWRGGVLLVLHHTAGLTPKGLEHEAAEMRSIQRQHMAGSRGVPFNDIGYNYVIAPSGRIFEGRGYNVRGAHTLMHNSRTIGVSLMGNLDVKRAPIRQKLALRWLVRRLRFAGARIVDVKGHREMPDQATACPGRFGIKLVPFARRAAKL